MFPCECTVYRPSHQNHSGTYFRVCGPGSTFSLQPHSKAAYTDRQADFQDNRLIHCILEYCFQSRGVRSVNRENSW
jgi:hypothetical protein